MCVTLSVCVGGLEGGGREGVHEGCVFHVSPCCVHTYVCLCTCLSCMPRVYALSLCVCGVCVCLHVFVCM